MRLKTRFNCAQCERHAQQGSLGRKSRSDWSYKGRKNKHGPVSVWTPERIAELNQTQV